MNKNKQTKQLFGKKAIEETNTIGLNIHRVKNITMTTDDVLFKSDNMSLKKINIEYTDCLGQLCETTITLFCDKEVTE